MSGKALADRLEVARAAALEAGALTLRWFRSASLAVDSKADGSVVTQADRETEALLRARIGSAFPEDEIIGEEAPPKPGGSGYRWILDPIDGTIAFVRGVPLYGVLIGIEFESRVVAGVVCVPGIDELVYASRGGGAWWSAGGAKPVRCRASGVRRLADACLCFTSPLEAVKGAHAERIGELCRRCATVRGWSDIYAHVLVATGRADVAIEPAISVWDVAPLPVILSEAGGWFSDWEGKPDIRSGTAVSCAAGVRDETLAVLGGGVGSRSAHD